MAFDCFIKLEGVEGESTDEAHAGEIDVLSFQWGVSQTGTGGRGGGAGAGKADVMDFSFVHKVDKASPVLFQKCCAGEHIPTAVVTLRKSGGDKLEYLKYKFSQVLISSVRPGGAAQGGDEIPMEEVSLNFAAAEIDYDPQTEAGAGGGPVHGGWDFAKNVKK